MITLLGITAPVLTLAISIDNFANGITRPIAGFVSDIIGREKMMLLMFSLEGAALAWSFARPHSVWICRLRRGDFSLLGRNLRYLSGNLRGQLRHRERRGE